MGCTRNCCLVLGVVALLVTSGCGPKRNATSTFHDPNMDFSLIQNVAVLPFENLTSGEAAAERVRDTFMAMLQATQAVYVLPPGEVGRGIVRTAMTDPTRPSAEEVIALGRVLEADVVVTGSVLEYGEARSGGATANYVSVSVRMLETGSGRVVWTAAATRGGVSTADRLFGGGGRPMNAVTVEAVDDLLDQLFGS